MLQTSYHQHPQPTNTGGRANYSTSHNAETHNSHHTHRSARNHQRQAQNTSYRNASNKAANTRSYRSSAANGVTQPEKRNDRHPLSRGNMYRRTGRGAKNIPTKTPNTAPVKTTSKQKSDEEGSNADKGPLKQPVIEDNVVEVGGQFVEKYYESLNASTDKLFKLYSNNGSFSFGNLGLKEKPAVGRDAIKAKIASLNLAAQKIKVDITAGSVDIQQSVPGTISILVTSVLQDSVSDVWRPFVQNFILEKSQNAERNAYYIRNDIFRFIDSNLLNKAALQQRQLDLISTMEVPKVVIFTPGAALMRSRS